MHRLSSLPSRLLLLGLAVGLAFGAVRGQADAPFDVESLKTVESRKQALEELASVAERKRREGDLHALVRALNNACEIDLKLNDKDSALSAAREALDLSRQKGDAQLLADTLIVAGVVYREREDSKTALQLLNEAHDLSVSQNYRRGAAQSLTELGTAYFNHSEIDKAAACGEAALQSWRELQDRRGEAHALSDLGAPYMRLGRLAEAAGALESASAIWRELGNPMEEASTLLDLDFLAIREGQWGQALTLLNQIQPLVTDKEAEPYISGQIATSFGEVYEAYGQLDAARNYFSEAATLYRDYARDVAAAVDASRKAGRVQARLGDYEGAVRQIEEGLGLAQKIDDKFRAALCHDDLGRVHLSSDLYEQAKGEFLQAMSGYEQAGSGSRRERARAQAFLAQTDYMLGDWTAASKSYGEALQVFREKEDYTDEAAVCFGLGKVEMEQQNLKEAGQHLKRSIDLTEQLRENVAGKELRSSFLGSIHDRYDAYVELLMQLDAARPGEGFDKQAFEASELGRARSLLDSLGDHQKELRQAADPSLLVEEEELQKKEQSLLDRRAELQSGGGDAEDLAKVEDELTRVRARYETVEAQINSTSRYNNLLRPSPLSFEEIRTQVTDADTSLLEFSLGGRESYLWVVTPDGLSSYKLPGKQTLEEAGLRLAKLLAARPKGSEEEVKVQQAETQQAADEVSRLVLGPVAGKLRSQRLIVVPDGILQYIPFQILSDAPSAGEPLVARHEIINAPSASTLVLLRRETAGRPAAPKLLAAFGAPVLPSNYASKAPAQGQERSGTTPSVVDGQQRDAADNPADTLRPNRIGSAIFTGEELSELRKLAPADEALVYSGFDATRDHLRELDLRQYRILHFATHGLLYEKQPELSCLVLSLVDRDGRPVSGVVGLSDIYNLRAPVDLVVLSACSSALGGDVRGEGLMGLTRGFMYAGASSVVSSLWKVNDEATAELMKRFYANMLQRGMTPAAALRAAQNDMRQDPQWRSPYYWAAFTLQGEYRQTIQPAAQGTASAYMKTIGAAALLALLAGAAWWHLHRRGKLPARTAGTIRR